MSLEEPLTESGMPTRNRYSEDHESHSGSVAASTAEEAHEDIAGPSEDETSRGDIETMEASRGYEPDTVDQEDGEEDEGFGDEFDDFEEGAEDDFGDFDEAPVETINEEPSLSTATISHTQPMAANELVSGAPESCYKAVHKSDHMCHQPLLDYSGLDNADDIAEACRPYFEKMFPSLRDGANLDAEALPDINPVFLSERSQSLWAQLVAPPPLQPPDWVRSRIRRLFLVSLGVPVDLDEILPASKQKKLILPSMTFDGKLHATSAADPGTQTTDADIPSTTGEVAASRTDKRQRGPARPPDIDINSLRRLCSMTDTALTNMTRIELQAHIARLHDLTQQANETLQAWLVQKDSVLAEKQAFEEVIENLVKHAQKIRK